ncbi:hypothetical protein SPHINGOT1_510022 [Sphingomonas sp. T1]|nr:hypothetical protein SPHINGOT1_510022 [Sphingomonas sp. T1]
MSIQSWSAVTHGQVSTVRIGQRQKELGYLRAGHLPITGAERRCLVLAGWPRCMERT